MYEFSVWIIIYRYPQQGLQLFLRGWPTWQPRREPPAVWRWAGFTIFLRSWSTWPPRREPPLSGGGQGLQSFLEAGPHDLQGGSCKLSGGGQGLQSFLRSWSTWPPRRELPAVWRWAGFTIIFGKLVHITSKEGAASCLEVGRVYNYFWVADTTWPPSREPSTVWR